MKSQFALVDGLAEWVHRSRVATFQAVGLNPPQLNDQEIAIAVREQCAGLLVVTISDSLKSVGDFWRLGDLNKLDKQMNKMLFQPGFLGSVRFPLPDSDEEYPASLFHRQFMIWAADPAFTLARTALEIDDDGVLLVRKTELDEDDKPPPQGWVKAKPVKLDLIRHSVEP